ncbi:glycosyl transferase family 1 [Humibacillus xanthopallidus]|uniref:Glycosyl transferase family 1 n=1 Tax=Humibacillus xanthopallidus TaxID=412689 RepID=A0A543PXJ5_9MICO|nr:glycosyl transferase family 1 [Humibacillus xanthopallidus]
MRTWCELYPADELVVLGPSWVRDSFAGPDVDFVTWPNERVVARSTGQMLLQPLLAAVKKVDAVVSLSPIVSPLVFARPTFCFEHDWRHLKNKDEFGVAQRAYRKLWELSAARATGCLCISDKAENETLELVRTASTEIVPNGGDHPRRWEVGDLPVHPRPMVVTFGHHNNKRPDLVIRGMAKLPDNAALTVLGARGELAAQLKSLAASLGKEEDVLFPGFVEEPEYQRIIAGADCVVVASSDEGFGLPIAEALYFGIPVVVAEDSGVSDMHGPDVIAAQPTPAGMAQAMAEALARGRTASGGVSSWADTVQLLRKKVANSL